MRATCWPIQYRPLLYIVAIAVCTLPLAGAAVGAERRWASTDAQAPGVLEARFGRAGWNCAEAVELPAPNQWLAACRRKTPASDSELRLILFSGAAPAPKSRVVARFADAAKVTMRLFTPKSPCLAGNTSACLTAVVLVDQRDESSCYGTQVLASTTARHLRSLGFINEVKVEAGNESCVGPLAVVSGTPVRAVIELPGPLAKIARSGITAPLSASAVAYSVSATYLTLRRNDHAR